MQFDVNEFARYNNIFYVGIFACCFGLVSVCNGMAISSESKRISDIAAIRWVIVITSF